MKLFILPSFFFIMSFLIFPGCLLHDKTGQETDKFDRETVFSLPDETVLNVKIADTDLKLVSAISSKAQSEGLSNKDTLPQDGMIFFFREQKSLSFWMKNMLFAIDIIWIADDEIIGMEKNVLPPPPNTKTSDLSVYSSPQKADTVIELKAGDCDRLNITTGTKIEITGVKNK